MMKSILLLSFLFTSFSIYTLDEYQKEIIQFRQQLNADYLSPDKSPLDETLREKFRQAGGHPFFEIDKDYRVEATFTLNGKKHTVTIHQSHRSRVMEEYKDLLFFMFTDLTNGEETYGGGRYIDLKIPEGETIILDFNKAYHPYCAFTTGYSCPVPPRENFMDEQITAGIKLLELK